MTQKIEDEAAANSESVAMLLCASKRRKSCDATMRKRESIAASQKGRTKRIEKQKRKKKSTIE